MNSYKDCRNCESSRSRAHFINRGPSGGFTNQCLVCQMEDELRHFPKSSDEALAAFRPRKYEKFQKVAQDLQENHGFTNLKREDRESSYPSEIKNSI